MSSATWFGRYRPWLAVIAAVGLIVGTRGDLGAQDRGTVAFQGRGGVAVPVGDFADVTGPGLTLGTGVAYWIGPRLAIRAEGSVSLLPGKGSEGPGSERPGLDLFHYGAGLQLQLTDPELSRFHFLVNVGAGATLFDSEDLPGAGAEAELTETYFTVSGGLGVGLDIASGLSLVMDGQWYLAFTDEEDTAVLTSVPEPGEGFDRASVLPIRLGLRIRTN